MAIALDIVEATEQQERQTDETLLSAYLHSGDMRAFTDLFDRYKGPILRYLTRIIHDTHVAEEVLDDTFMKVALKAHQFDTAKRFRPWVFAIANNCAIDRQRREAKHASLSLDIEQPNGAILQDLLVDESPDPLETCETAEDVGWLQNARLSLRDDHEAVVYLVYDQGLKYREASEALHIPIGTLKSRIHAAIGKLVEMYEEQRAA